MRKPVILITFGETGFKVHHRGEVNTGYYSSLASYFQHIAQKGLIYEVVVQAIQDMARPKRPDIDILVPELPQKKRGGGGER